MIRVADIFPKLISPSICLEAMLFTVLVTNGVDRMISTVTAAPINKNINPASILMTVFIMLFFGYIYVNDTNIVNKIII